MTEVFGLPKIGSEEFWKLYDKFCDPAHLEKFVQKGESPHTPQICKILESAHNSGAIHRISRPGRRWAKHKAWLSLRNAPIRNDEGNPVIQMRTGDVIVVEWGWDRDVIITHTPIYRNIVSGHLLSGRWEEMVGLFMPLFDQKTINKCIELRITKNVEEAIALANEEAQDWQWY